MEMQGTCRRTRPGRGLHLALALLPLSLFTGCLSLSFECGGGNSSAGQQSGSVLVHPGEEIDVYYPAPYGAPPNLEVAETFDSAMIVDQKSDHFRVRVKDTVSARTVKWKARGILAVATPPVIAPIPPPTSLPQPPSSTPPPIEKP